MMKKEVPGNGYEKDWADISKGRKLLGWSTLVSFEKGFDRTIAWYMVKKNMRSKVKVKK